jgi:UDP-glucose 4-epimerase
VKVLIAGGAGYSGSTIASACSDAGMVPVILDSLLTGVREFTAGQALYQYIPQASEARAPQT